MSESFKHVVREIYCEVLFELAEESGQVDDIMADISRVVSILSSEPDFTSLITSNIILGDEKSQIVRRVFEGKVSPLALDFLCVLARRNRMNFLTSISDGYESLVDKHHNRSLIEVTLPKAPDNEHIEQLRTQLSEALKSQVKLAVHVDPSLIGGIVIKRGEKTIDHSIKRILSSTVKTVLGKSRETISLKQKQN